MENTQETYALRENLRKLIVPLIIKIRKDKPSNFVSYCADYFQKLYITNSKNVDKSSASELFDAAENSNGMEDHAKPLKIQGSSSMHAITDYDKEYDLREISSWGHPTQSTKKTQKQRKQIIYNRADFTKQMGDQPCDLHMDMEETLSTEQSKSNVNEDSEMTYAEKMSRGDLPNSKEIEPMITKKDLKNPDYERNPELDIVDIENYLDELVDRASLLCITSQEEPSVSRKKWERQMIEQSYKTKRAFISELNSCSDDNSSGNDNNDYNKHSSFCDDDELLNFNNEGSRSVKPHLQGEYVRKNVALSSTLIINRMNELVNNFSKTCNNFIFKMRAAELSFSKKLQLELENISKLVGKPNAFPRNRLDVELDSEIKINMFNEFPKNYQRPRGTIKRNLSGTHKKINNDCRSFSRELRAEQNVKSEANDLKNNAIDNCKKCINAVRQHSKQNEIPKNKTSRHTFPKQNLYEQNLKKISNKRAFEMTNIKIENFESQSNMNDKFNSEGKTYPRERKELLKSYKHDIFHNEWDDHVLPNSPNESKIFSDTESRELANTTRQVTSSIGRSIAANPVGVARVSPTTYSQQIGEQGDVLHHHRRVKSENNLAQQESPNINSKFPVLGIYSSNFGLYSQLKDLPVEETFASEKSNSEKIPSEKQRVNCSKSNSTTTSQIDKPYKQNNYFDLKVESKTNSINISSMSATLEASSFSADCGKNNTKENNENVNNNNNPVEKSGSDMNVTEGGDQFFKQEIISQTLIKQNTEPGLTSAGGDFEVGQTEIRSQQGNNLEESSTSLNEISIAFVENAVKEALEAQSKDETDMEFDYFLYDNDSSESCSSQLSEESYTEDNENNDDLKIK